MSTLASSPALSNPPARPGHFLFGSIRDVQRNPLRFYVDTRQQYGDIVRLRALPSYYWYLVSHPRDVEHVLQTNQANYRKPDVAFNRPMSLLTGESLLTSEGQYWRRQRRLAQPAFHRAKLAALAGVMTESAQITAARWEELAQSNQIVDISAEMTRLTLQVASRTLFSIDVSGAADVMGSAMRVTFEYINHRMLNLFALPESIPTLRNRRFLQARRTLDELVYRIISERRRDLTACKEANDLLAMLLVARDEETGEGMTDRQLRDEVITLMLAGHETGASALAWTWYLLDAHPNVAVKLRAELKNVLSGRVPTFDDLSHLPYTRMIFDEAMRLYPPAWGLLREAIQQDEIGGYRIPAKSLVLVCQWVTHRHPDVWESSNEFDPERFAPERAKARPKFAYFPFGGGARGCIGANFALMEAQLILATLAQRFTPRLVAGHKVEPDPTFTLRPRDGLPMTILAQD